MPAIDAITFDLWQTLIIDDRELGRARTQRRLEGAIEALTDAGYDYSLDHLREAYRSCFRACRVIHHDEKDVTFDEQVNMFIDFIDEGLSTSSGRRRGGADHLLVRRVLLRLPSPCRSRRRYGCTGGAVKARVQTGHDIQHRHDTRAAVPQVSGSARPP